MRISDWSSDVCSSDLTQRTGLTDRAVVARRHQVAAHAAGAQVQRTGAGRRQRTRAQRAQRQRVHVGDLGRATDQVHRAGEVVVRLRQGRSEEHTSELQSLMRISYAVFCLKNKKKSIIKKAS